MDNEYASLPVWVKTSFLQFFVELNRDPTSPTFQRLARYLHFVILILADSVRVSGNPAPPFKPVFLPNHTCEQRNPGSLRKKCSQAKNYLKSNTVVFRCHEWLISTKCFSGSFLTSMTSCSTPTRFLSGLQKHHFSTTRLNPHSCVFQSFCNKPPNFVDVFFYK